MGERDGQQARATEHEQEQRLQPQQHGVGVKPASGAQANHMLASLVGQRVTPPVKAEHDFGEHIVGSDNNLEHIHAPWNLSDTPATAAFEVSGEGFQLISTNLMALQPSTRMQGDDVSYAERASPKIAFRPRRVGEFRGMLTIRLSWPMDGHVETQTIVLRGGARELTHAPAQVGAEPGQEVSNARNAETVASGKNHEEDSETVLKRKDLRKRDEVDAAIEHAAAAARKLARSQNDGLAIVEKEAAAYGKELQRAPRSKWWDLAEMALNLATGSLAGLVASKLLPRLLTKVVIEDLPMVGRVETTIAPKLSESITGTIKSAITLAGAKAIKAALPSESGSAGSPASASTGKHSSNARIDFFAEQKSILNAQEDAYEDEVKRRSSRIRVTARRATATTHDRGPSSGCSGCGNLARAG